MTTGCQKQHFSVLSLPHRLYTNPKHATLNDPKWPFYLKILFSRQYDELGRLWHLKTVTVCKQIKTDQYYPQCNVQKGLRSLAI